MRSFAHDWATRFLLLEALFWLGVSRLQLTAIPFRWITPGLCQKNDQSWESRESVSASKRIGWVVRSVAGHTPWPSTCLVQAIAAKRMLQRRRIPSIIYLGVAKPADAPMQAHAWLVCNDCILTGEAGHQQFTVVATFEDSYTLH